MARRPLILLLMLQSLTHLFWLSPSAHSGQVAIPWMMNRGMRLFGEIWEQHAPGSSLLAAAAQALLPMMEAALLVKLLNTALALALTMLVYQLAKRLSGQESAGLAAALVWAWWEPVYGNVMLYFDTLLAACVLSALLVYYRQPSAPSRRQIILMGLLMGAATLFKQQAWLAVGIVGIWLALRQDRRSALAYALATLILPLLQWLVLAGQGLFDSYVYWNWTFNLAGFMDGVPLDGDFFRKLLLSNLLVIPFTLLAWRSERRRLLLALMWLATLTLLWPRFGEIHAMGHLPFAAVMSGLALARVWPQLADPKQWDSSRIMLIGLALGIGIGWLWTGAVSYIPTRLGLGAVLGYDEFDRLVSALEAETAEGDTLFVLPETDSTPQLHARAQLPPPGAWVKGWRWYFRPEFVLETLRNQWRTNPPTWVVVFSDHIVSGSPGILELLAIVQDRYDLRFRIADIFDHGAAEVYRLRA